MVNGIFWCIDALRAARFVRAWQRKVGHGGGGKSGIELQIEISEYTVGVCTLIGCLSLNHRSAHTQYLTMVYNVTRKRQSEDAKQC